MWHNFLKDVSIWDTGLPLFLDYNFPGFFAEKGIIFQFYNAKIDIVFLER